MQKAIKFLKLGQVGIGWISKLKYIPFILKHFPKQKKKRKKRKKKVMWKRIFCDIKKGFVIIKEYCYYIKRIFCILKER